MFEYVPPCNLEGLQLYLSQPSKSSLTNFQKHLPRYFVATMLTKPIKVEIQEPLEVVLVMFHKVRTAHLFKTPMEIFTDNQMDLADMYPNLVRVFDEQFRADISLGKKIKAVNHLLVQISNQRTYNDNLVYYLVDTIYQKNGHVKVKDLKDSACTSYKTLETKFKRNLGMTPKMYIDIVRANRTLHCLKNLDSYHGQQLMQSTGFYDESHLIKCFKKYFDATPKQMYKKLNQPIWFKEDEFASQILNT